MELIWARVGMDVIVGEIQELLSVMASGAMVQNPMLMQHISVMQQQNVKVPGRPAGPQSLTGFKLVPIPCSEILLNHVDYAGTIKEHDPVYVTYYKVREAVEEQAKSPMMVNQ